MNTMYLSGIRLVMWLNEDSTYPRLQSNIEQAFPSTPSRQNSPNTPTIRTIQYTPRTGARTLEVDAQVSGKSQTMYSVKVMFNNVRFNGADSPLNVTFTTSAGSARTNGLNNSTLQ